MNRSDTIANILDKAKTKGLFTDGYVYIRSGTLIDNGASDEITFADPGRVKGISLSALTDEVLSTIESEL